MSLNEELIKLKQQLKEQDKEIRRIKKENDFLEEASAFFAASRLKSVRTKFIAIKTNDGMFKGNTAFYCRMLHWIGYNKLDRIFKVI